MNEKVVAYMQVKEDEKLTEKVAVSLQKDVSEHRQVPLNLAEDTCNSDEVLAKMLQRQFDEEYVEMCKSTKNNFKGASEISSNYQNTQKQTESESDDEELVENPDEKRFWDRFDKLEKEFNIMPTCGLRLAQGGTTITKHGKTMSSRKNACKINRPPKFHTGNRTLVESQVAKGRFRSLEIFEMEDWIRWGLKWRREPTYHEFDICKRTSKLLHKMICNRLLEGVSNVIHYGKQSFILHAFIGDSKESKMLPKEYTIKAFRYIRGDKKLEDEKLERKIISGAVRRLAEKEMYNLNKLKRVGVPCPEVIALNEHLLVMDFIGKDGAWARSLKGAELNKKKYTAAYNQVVKCMAIMYNKARLIHADLSGYNILWHNDKCYFTDVTKSVEPGEANAFQFLMEDCRRISKFFKSESVEHVKTADELFFDITGCDYSDKLTLSAMEEKFKMNLHFIDRADSKDVSGKSGIGVLTKIEHGQVEAPVDPPIDPPTT